MSKLHEHLSMWRADRPDEWTMDEFIRKAMDIENELIAEQAKRLKFAATISRMQKKIDRLELSESTKRQFEDECG